MDGWFDVGRKLLEFQLPSLPVYIKSLLTLIVGSLSLLFIIAMWRDPAPLRALDPVTHDRLEQGLVRFFKAYSGPSASSPAEVFGSAKDIARRMKNEPDIFVKIDAEIEARKRNDNNWTYANRLQVGKDLVNALGLTPETVRETEIFLQMPLPDLNKP